MDKQKDVVVCRATGQGVIFAGEYRKFGDKKAILTKLINDGFVNRPLATLGSTPICTRGGKVR